MKMYINRYRSSSAWDDSPFWRRGSFWGKLLGVCLLALALYGGALFLTRNTAGIQILEYHKVNDRDKDVYTVGTAEFKEQLDYLQAEGYETISLLDFLRAKKGKQELPAKPIILTFDDGYEDNYDIVLPMLEERGMKATVFMVTNDIDLPGYLSLNQLLDMQNRGIEIGSHTANHLPLTGMSIKTARDELQKSKLIMEWKKIKTVFGFSYPNGKYSDDLCHALQAEEYLAAVTGDPGLNDFMTNPYLLHRTNILPSTFGLWEFRFRLAKSRLYKALNLWQH